MITLIHVFCRNFTEIVSQRQEMDATMRCFSDKKTKRGFSGAVLRPLAEGAKSFQGSVPRDPASFYKISFQSVPIWWSYSRKK